MNSSVLSIVRGGFWKRYSDPNFHNVIINAIAVMFLYSGHFGSCAIAPIVIESMSEIGGINAHLLFTGMAISSGVTVLCAPFLSPAIDRLGTRACLVLGGLFITTLPPSLIYPIPPIFLTFQAVNGLGCALLRASSLKFLTDSSPYDKLAEYNGLHWSIFMACVLFGNSALFFATGSNESIDDNLRYRICICLTAIGAIGILLYLTAIRRTDCSLDEDGEDAPLLASPKSNGVFDHDEQSGKYMEAKASAMEMEQINHSRRVSEEYLLCTSDIRSFSKFSNDRGYPDSESTTSTEQPGFWDSTRQLLRWPTLNLTVAMFSCAVFPSLFTTLGPLFIGRLLPDKRYVALFGICAGIGEVLGSLLSGKVIARTGIKVTAGIVMTLALVSVGLSALAFPLTTGDPVLAPSPALLLLLGIFLGVGDSTNGVILSTLIGRIYRDSSQAGFALYSLVFNLSCIAIYLLSSYTEFVVVVVVMVVLLVNTFLAILTLPNKEIAE